MHRIICLLTILVATVAPELLQRAGSNLASNSLFIEEITQIMHASDPTGKNHSIRVITSEHEPLKNVVEWKFFQHTNEDGFIAYKIPGNGENPSTQTEFIFDGNLIDSDSYLLQAKNSSEDIAMDYKVVPITDLETNIAWVGERSDLSQSSLRVMTSEQVGDITVDENVCTFEKNPCYILAPETKPSSIKRCVSISEDFDISIQQCDERIVLFNGISESLPIEIQEDGSLTVEFTYAGEHFYVEAVAYDPKDKSNIYSSYPYKCRFPVGKFWVEGDSMKCRHDISLPEDQTEMMVLIVVIDEDDNVLRSTLQYFDKNAHNKLSIDQITWVMRDDDSTGENHNIRVKFSHQSLADIKQWKLTLHENTRELITYTVDADGSNPSTQQEAVFRGRLEKSDAVALQAWNSDGSMTAVDFITVDIADIKSHVTWVGEDEEPTLRVIADDFFPEIYVGKKVCTKKESPCYYVSPSPQPTTVERCINKYINPDRIVNLCDERLTETPEISPTPSVTLNEDGKISVQLKLTDNNGFQIEVFAFDAEDHTKLFSQSDYSCLVPTGVESNEPDTMTCLHKASIPEGLRDFFVIVVKTDENGKAIASSFVHYDGNGETEENVGAIVGIIVGVIVGVALIAFLVIYCLKKREPAAASSQSTSYKYSAAATQEDKSGATPAEEP